MVLPCPGMRYPAGINGSCRTSVAPQVHAGSVLRVPSALDTRVVCSQHLVLLGLLREGSERDLDTETLRWLLRSSYLWSGWLVGLQGKFEQLSVSQADSSF